MIFAWYHCVQTAPCLDISIPVFNLDVNVCARPLAAHCGIPVTLAYKVINYQLCSLFIYHKKIERNNYLNNDLSNHYFLLTRLTRVTLLQS